MILRSFLLVFSGLLALTSSHAISAVNADDIRNRANAFLAEYSHKLATQYNDAVRIEHSVGLLDNRLSMAQCPEPLTVELKSRQTVGRISLKVSCVTSVRWTLYVPAEIKLFRPVVTLANPVSKGTLLDKAQLLMREMDISRFNGNYFTDLDQVQGLQAKRHLRADHPLIASHLEQPVMVKRGDAVLVSANSSGLVVKMPGIALVDGREGEQIRVRNSQSKRVVDARVVGPGQVLVTM